MKSITPELMPRLIAAERALMDLATELSEEVGDEWTHVRLDVCRMYGRAQSLRWSFYTPPTSWSGEHNLGIFDLVDIDALKAKCRAEEIEALESKLAALKAKGTAAEEGGAK